MIAIFAQRKENAIATFVLANRKQSEIVEYVNLKKGATRVTPHLFNQLQN
ncbi:hypothetical protein [Microcoleus sp. K4-C2]